MKKVLMILACSLLVSVFFAGIALAAADPIREGKWEFVNEVRMEGMPQIPALPPGVSLPAGMTMSGKGNTIKSTVIQCINPKEPVPASDPTSDPKQSPNCKITRMDRKGNQVSWTVVCSEGGIKTTGEGLATYKGDVMDSRMTMASQGQGQSMRQQITTRGRYLGPCGK